MWDRIISDDPFWMRYVPDQYKHQQIFDKAVDDSLAVLKFVPDCFVTSKMIKLLFTPLYAGQSRLYFYENSCNVVLIVMEWVFLIQLSIILTLMTLVMMKMILILSFISDFWKMQDT